MRFDPKLASLLSNFCLDISKAYFIAGFITPALSGITSVSLVILTLTKTLLSAILFLAVSWILARLGENKT